MAIFCSLSAMAQVPRTYKIEGVAQRFSTALGIPVKASSFFNTSSDTAIVFIDPSDTTTIHFKYKGVAKKLAASNIPWDSITGKPSTFATTYLLSNDVKDSIQRRVRYADTASLFANRLKISDTASMIASRLKVSDTAFMLSNRLKISDTANILSGTIRTFGNQSGITGNKTFTNNLTANSFIKSSGTADQLLAANGDVQSKSDIHNGAFTFDTTGRLLTIPTLGGGSYSVLIPRGTASGAEGITALTSSKVGNLVTVFGDNGSSTTFSIRDADSAITARLSDSTLFNAGRWLPNRSEDSIKVIRALANTKGVGTVTSVSASAGTGISISGSPITSSGTITITNTAPDQVVSLTAGTGISISGTYPNFTVTNTSTNNGTVTSVGLTAPTGFSVSGSPVTSSGTLGLSFAAGYSLPTDASQTNWNTAFNKRLSSASLSSSQLTLTLADASTVTASVPTFNQNTTGTAGSLSAVLSSTLGGAGSVSGLLKANGSGVVSAAVAGDITSLISGTYVDLTTNQTIGGNKTLSSFLSFSSPTSSLGAGTTNSSWFEANTGTAFNVRISGGDRFRVSSTEAISTVPISGTSLSMSGAGSFGGAVSGTTATFGGIGTFQGGDNGTALFLKRTGGINVMAINVNSDGSFEMFDHAAGSFTSGITQKSGTVLINTTTTDGTNKLIVNGGVKFGTGGTATITAAGAATFSSSVTASGYRFAYASKSSNYTLTDTDDYINVTSSCTITLPTAVGRSGKRYVIKCTGSAVATIASTSSQTIDGNAASTYSFGGPNFNIMIVYSDGSNWFLEAWATGI